MKKVKYKMVVVAGDFHIPFEDKEAVLLFIKFLKDQQPSKVIINGDFLDCFSISKFDKTPITGKDLMTEIKIGRRYLKLIREAVPKARIIYVFGNHEFRLRQYLIRQAPELYGLEGLSLPELLHLKEFDIEVVDTKELATRFIDTYYQIGELYVGHFDKVANYSAGTAKALVESRGVSVVQSHCHRTGVYRKTLLSGRELIGVEIGCLCNRNPSYIANPNWMCGWCVIWKKENSNRFCINLIDVINGKFFYGDKEYRYKD